MEIVLPAAKPSSPVAKIINMALCIGCTVMSEAPLAGRKTRSFSASFISVECF